MSFSQRFKKYWQDPKQPQWSSCRAMTRPHHFFSFPPRHKSGKNTKWWCLCCGTGIIYLHVTWMGDSYGKSVYIPDYSSPTDAMDQNFFGVFSGVHRCQWQCVLKSWWVRCTFIAPKCLGAIGRDLRRTAPKRSELNYCWWKNSGDHQLRLVVYPSFQIYSLYIPGGDRQISEPSTGCKMTRGILALFPL